MSADRNLLFGLLALQNDFITRDALVGAFGAWVAAKDRPLGALLVERGDLAAALRDVLETLVDSHVTRHGGDPARSLAALSSVDGAAAEALAVLPDPDVRASLGSVNDRTATFVATGPLRTIASAGASAPGQSRFSILRFHAKGGLGRVSVALDRELGREVAYKEIQDDRADDGHSRDRFTLEAEVTGGLEHPGIVPVYSLGRDPAGRPYYAMRFIRGEELGRVIDRFHQASPAASAAGVFANPVEPRRFATVAFRDLLGRFLDVCDAVSYAHDRGVLHRDLKPGNIMLGRYGETLVVDWGLARLADAPPEASSEEAPLRPTSGSSGGTEAGAAVGTPGFMSPEQAAGRLDLLGPATDVYALGAILYAVLTGRQPFDDPDREARLTKTRDGAFPRPRQVAAAVPAALEAVCLKAMALLPEDRYPTAKALADDLKRWLADEPVAAYREPLSARVRRWARRNGRLVSAAAATMLMGLVGTGVVAAVATAANARINERNVQLDAANKRIVAQGRRITDQNTTLVTTNEDLETARAEAVAERDQSRAVTDFLVRSFRSPDPNREGRTITIAEVLDRAVDELGRDAAVTALTKSAVLDAIGSSYTGLGLVAEAVGAKEAGLRLKVDELGAGHPDTLALEASLATSYFQAGRTAEALPLFEKTLPALRAHFGPEHRSTLVAQSDLATAYASMNRPADAIALHESTLAARRAQFGPDDPDTLSSQDGLAAAYYQAGRTAEALPLFERTLAAQRAALGDDHPKTLSSRNNLAYAYDKMGRLDQAVTLHERNLEAASEKLGPDHPNTLRVRNNLAFAYEKAGRLDQAIALHERNLAARRAALGDDHPDTLGSENNLASCYLKAGRSAEALPLFERSLAARRTQQGPDHLATLTVQANLAGAYRIVGRFAEAEQFFLATHRAVSDQAALPQLQRDRATFDLTRRIIGLYEAWGKPGRAMEWRRKLPVTPLPEDVFARASGD